MHCAFEFFWAAATDAFDSDASAHSAALATAMAREKWSRDFFNELRASHQTHYEQWGDLRGTVRVGDEPPRTLCLRGMRDHSTGERDWGRFHRYVCNFVSFEDGTALEVVLVSLKNMTHLVTGYVCTPSGALLAVADTDVHLRDLGEGGVPPVEFALNFTDAGGRQRRLECKVVESPPPFELPAGKGRIHERIAEFRLDGVAGIGVSEFMYRAPGVRPLAAVDASAAAQEAAPALDTSAPLATPSVVALTDSLAMDASVCGGKAAGLARVAIALDRCVGVAASTPRGRVLTVAASEAAVPDAVLRGAIEGIEAALAPAAGRDKGAADTLETACARARALFEAAGDLKLAAEALTGAMPTARLAVRSSSPYEDRGDASAAGQFESVLGVAAEPAAVLSAVRRVWASAFSAHCVRYRAARRLPLLVRVAVVVMDLVPQVEAAGVAFSREPDAGVWRAAGPRLVITANYGLGESVVSGQVTPDSFFLSRPPVAAPAAALVSDGMRIEVGQAEDDVHLLETSLGSKALRCVPANGSCAFEPTPSELQGRACLEEPELVAVARAVLALERAPEFAGAAFAGGGLDVEFAVDAGKTVHLLQARAVVRAAAPIAETAADRAAWRSVADELDSATPSLPKELMTRCNIGEMSPGALTPLSLSTFGTGIDFGMVDLTFRAGGAAPLGAARRIIHARGGQLFIDMHQLGLLVMFGGTDKRTSDMSLCGREVAELPIEEIYKFHGGKLSLLRQLSSGLNFFKTLRGSEKRMRSFDRRIDLIGAEADGAEALWRRIDAALPLYAQCWAAHIAFSSRSGAWGTVLMTILSGGKGKEWKAEHYADVARLLAHCGAVESADVPSALSAIAETIAARDDAKTFAGAKPADAEAWLRTADSAIGERFGAFLERHGHRCVKEAELREPSWASRPARYLVPALQAAVLARLKQGGKTRAADSRGDDGAMPQLASTDVTRFGRFVLRQLLPTARRAVGQREWGKSVSIAYHDGFKRAYRELGERLAAEGLLADADLVFFCTHVELGLLCGASDARAAPPLAWIRGRAALRRRVQPAFEDLRFAEMSVGRPEPEAEASACRADSAGATGSTPDAATTLRGMPVSHGVVEARARVVRTLADAAALESGEVMVAPHTDVGWTPCFTLVAGLVTELGGLLSHGAVVAREYGLPCVVGIANATALVRDGDMVRLDGGAGTLTVLSRSG